MDIGDWLIRLTAWLAVSLYVASEGARARRRDGATRWLSTFGCAVFLAHVATAFQFHHHWSHASAYADTARQTAQLTGWNWGGGIFINYIFALVWLAEILQMHANPSRFLQRAPWLTWSTRAFFWFMIFNGAFVFVRGAQRWYGLLLSFVLVACWWPKRRLEQKRTAE